MSTTVLHRAGPERIAAPQPEAAPPPAPRLRPDVDGLRAVAILLVLLMHAGVGVARGGYVGVDVFFVISGYVITRMLVGELDRTRRISIARFYARRVKRLMPQAILVLVCTAVAAALLFPPVREEQVAHDVMAAGGYVMNVRLSAQAVDYFAQGKADGPLDHFWSLAVEEQFYLVWPLLLLGCAAIGRRRGAPAVLGALAAASFLYAVHATRVAPAGAYFNTAARAWELALGALLALALERRALPRALSAAAAWAGAAAIVLAATRYDSTTAFPAVPALLPTLGAAALIAAGATAVAPAPTRLLSTRPMRYLGRLSYAWYIWHWPVLVFAASVLGATSTPARLAVVAASLVPTVLTHHLLEAPVRNASIHVRRPRLALVGAPLGAAIAVGAAAALLASIPSTPSLASSQVRGAAVLEHSTALQRRARALRPTPRDANQDRGRPVDDGCLIDGNSAWAPRCTYGARKAHRTMVLFGDSHAFEYFTAMDKIARRHGWRLIELTKQGCPPADVLVFATFLGRGYPECGRWQRYALRQIAKHHPALVFTSGSAHYGVMIGGHKTTGTQALDALSSGYARMLASVDERAGAVAFIGDSPRPPFYVPDCVAQHMKDLRRCAFAKQPATSNSTQVRETVAAADPGVTTIDATPEYCPRSLCPAVIGDALVYRNSGHVTDTYTTTMVPWIVKHLPSLSARRR